jgi:RNA polymerase sigma-70 factor (ECF subfamily)
MSSIDEHINLESSYISISTEKEDLSKLVNKLIDKLPEKHSSVINMFYINEMTCEEISEAMNISISNVKVLLYRSRNALKDLIIKHNLADELL